MSLGSNPSPTSHGAAPNAVRPRGKSRFVPWAITALGVSVFLGSCGLFGWFAWMSENDRGMSAPSQVRALVEAMRKYERDHGRLPPAVMTKNGHPHSWRVLLLPYLGEGELYKRYRFEEAWDSDHNAEVALTMPAVYRSPSPYAWANGMTSYVVVVGDETAFPRDENLAINEAAVPDGYASTIGVVEMSGSDIPWAEPRDLDFAKLDFQINAKKQGISSHRPGGALVGMLDERVIVLPDDTPESAVREMLTRDDKATAKAISK